MDRDYLQSEYGVLKAGQCYKVVRSFRDYRNINYERGDVMRFLGSILYRMKVVCLCSLIKMVVRGK
ncbi:DUF3601 domain-containing protein [Vibrio cholerae]|nr:DUF3601 domain-containing protein [Vibrio cholerae]